LGEIVGAVGVGVAVGVVVVEAAAELVAAGVGSAKVAADAAVIAVQLVLLTDVEAQENHTHRQEHHSISDSYAQEAVPPLSIVQRRAVQQSVLHVSKRHDLIIKPVHRLIKLNLSASQPVATA